MQYWFAVAIGGALGAVVRYALSGWVIAQRFPMGTLVVNVVGCALIGALTAMAVKSDWPGPLARTFLIGGFLGALTTFSTFGYQTIELGRDHGLFWAALNLGSNLVIGLVAVLAGIWVGESLANSWNV